MRNISSYIIDKLIKQKYKFQERDTNPLWPSIVTPLHLNKYISVVISCDPHDMESLAPGHFLIGHLLLSIPDPIVLESLPDC